MASAETRKILLLYTNNLRNFDRIHIAFHTSERARSDRSPGPNGWFGPGGLAVANPGPELAESRPLGMSFASVGARTPRSFSPIEQSEVGTNPARPWAMGSCAYD